ncbi:MAG TPA: hypothetical protein VIX42_10240 [Edaphobacter sp.]
MSAVPPRLPDIVRLARRECNNVRERFGRNCDGLVKLADALGNNALGHTAGQFFDNRAW